MRASRMRTILFLATLVLGMGGFAVGCGAPGGEPEPAPVPDATPPTAETSDETPAPDTTAGPLADTSWQLVEFQSMDDAIGTIRPEDPSVYTMHLQADGTAAMQLDCNRGTGTWTAEPGEDGQSGSFGFGPLATTRALCPEPSMGERIARDAEYVRGFVLSDGRLYLSLMADAGIYAWEPLAESP